MSGRLLLTSMLFFFLIGQSTAAVLYPFESKAQETQFNHLLHDLRCLVCQNQDLADSNAGLAKDLRREVYQQVVSGRSDSEIMRYLTDRYGDFILFKPAMKLLTSFLWFGPAIFLLFGLYMFWRSCIRQVADA